MASWWMYTGHQAPLLEHTWTLAIEEHFYVVWPILLLTLTRRNRGVKILAGVLAAALLVILFTPWSEPVTHVRATYLRGFPIVWGSLLAVLITRARRRCAVGVIGFLCTAASLCSWPSC